MSSTREGWIFTKTRKFMEGGRLQIGQILSEPFHPDTSLLPNGPLELPKDLLHDKTEETNVSWDSERGLKAMFNLWADTTIAPVAASAGVKKDSTHNLSWQFDALKTDQISPPLDYVEKSMRTGEVPQHLKKWRYDKTIYMVTGVTIAKNAQMVRMEAETFEAKTSAKADLTTTVAPVSFGGKANIGSTDKVTEKVGQATDFVFAYSLNKIYYHKISQKPFRKGEVSGTGEHLSPEELAKVVAGMEIDDFELDDIDEETFCGNDEDEDEDEDEDGEKKEESKRHNIGNYVCLVAADLHDTEETMAAEA